MSDRIDELVDEIGAGWQDCPFCGQRPRYRVIRPVISWDVESDGPKCDALWHTLRPGDALNELATIAREAEARALKAEAMCEWLAEHWLHDSDPYEVCLHNDITVADILKAASEAVKEADHDRA